LVRKLDLPVSADTSRSLPARAALEAGARIINDVTGLTGDPGMGPLVARERAGIILMASERPPRSASRRTSRGWGPAVRGEQSEGPSRRTSRGWGPAVPGERSKRLSEAAGAISMVRALLEESLGLARAAGIEPSRIAVDPGIGFFRNQGLA